MTFRPGRRPARSAIGLLGLLAALLAGCGRVPQTALHPAGPVARMELGLMGLSMWIMIGIFVIVAGVLVFAVARYRERPGDRHIPKQVEGNARLELLWTVVPFILLIFIAIPTFRTNFVLAKVQTGSNVLDVTVIGHQWWWEFNYPSLGIVTADEMHIPVGTKINITLESADVLHSFWVPALAGKEDTVPGHPNTMWLEATQAGTFPGQCAEFCGTSHSLMRLLVIAQSPSQFQQWAAGFEHPNSTPHGAAATAGAKIFQADCATCHVIDGASWQGPSLTATQKNPYGFPIAPNLTDLSAHETLAAATLANTPSDLVEWINNASLLMPGVIMPPFQGVLSQSQEQDVAAYLEGLT